MGRARPSKGKAEAKPPRARKSLKDDDARVRDLEKRLAEALEREAGSLSQLQARNHELGEAQEQQGATAEILRVISGSPTDVQPVFEAIVRNAVDLCGASQGGAYRFDGELIHSVAHAGYTAEQLTHWRGTYPRKVTDAEPIGRAILTKSVDLIRDVESGVGRGLNPEALANMRARGSRSVLTVPLLRDGEVIGAISLAHRDMNGFSDVQVQLLTTFADQAVIAIENVRLFTELQQKNEALTQAHAQVSESLEQQTATAEILSVISGSPTDIRPVFDAVLDRALTLCEASNGSLYQLEDGALRHVGVLGIGAITAVGGVLSLESAPGWAVLEKRTVHIEDVLQELDRMAPEVEAGVRRSGVRTVAAVPLLREQTAIGAIFIRRLEVRPFSEKQIRLLQTFADQAVIAIENVRLFTELEARNRDLTKAHAQVSETLEQQTATSEILRVISSSPTDLQPVFEAIASRVVRLCDAFFSTVWRYDGSFIHHAADNYPTEEMRAILTKGYPAPPRRESAVAQAISECRIIHIEDLLDVSAPVASRDVAIALGYRTVLCVPMLRDGVSIGALAVARREQQPFSDRQIELVKTFAEQAVIAIENVRLFTELQASNRELTTALDTQTATSDILRVISRSQTDVQPVFDAIVQSAVRLLRAHSGMLTRVAGDWLELAAFTSIDGAYDDAIRAYWPRPLHSKGGHTQAIRERAPINIADAEVDPRVPEAGRAVARLSGLRSVASVPLLRNDEAIGTVVVNRQEPGGFTADEIALLQTFADQAVIAIENARLLSELQARTQELTRSVEQLTALGDVGRAVSSSLDLDTVLATIVGRAVQLSGTDGGTIFEYDEGAEEFTARATLNADESQSAMLRATRLRRGEGAVGQMAVTREPLQIPDIAAEGAYESRIRGAMLAAGTRSVLAIPLLHEERIVGGLVVTRRTPGAFTAGVVEILRTFATQSALAIQNARLFREVEIKSRELEVASQHKSEFLASMSHELRTPLNAIIGFSDVLLEGMFGETNEKQTEYLRDILASGQHLLSLINDILDLSKIEAGRMELEVAAFDLPTAIDDALLLMRERAGRRGITLERQVDARVGEIHGDQRKVKQVLLNLLSNAVKFTPEGGRIDVRAGLTNSTAEISVTDTGIGIAAEDHEAVFEEFRQVGTADRKAEGTGLGLALCRKFVELHGGRIWVKSQVGVGSTFTFAIPARREPATGEVPLLH